MGNTFGALRGHALKKIRRFNIENRTERLLEKNVKNPPPKPLATQREIEKLQNEMPTLMEEISKPNPELLDRLKDVYVSSLDKPPETPEHSNPSRPLPVERKPVTLELGYVEPEPESITPGRLSLRQALILLSKYQKDNKVNNIEALALEYNLKKEDVGHIVEYFKLYTLVDSDQKTSAFDVTPYVKDPLDNIPMNVLNSKRYVELMQKLPASKEKSDKVEDNTKIQTNEMREGNEERVMKKK